MSNGYVRGAGQGYGADFYGRTTYGVPGYRIGYGYAYPYRVGLTPQYDLDYFPWSLSDEEIFEMVDKAIENDVNISPSDQKKIKVKVNNAIVTLSGKVKNRNSKIAAFNDAFWQIGVMDVDNKIKVESQQRKK